ncbi:aminotransferase class I/II-fold pyridoxal phosphate-dependent enzyme [Haloarculaceae archaeon H-GB2-1]|nr:aminotransferase class I/II-fold pyridoxal phosphate-dependent enzyme [Haloarculaceae archaeon H-GB1-1]MEA5387915.1 aminotransferase class I/II-fold pyridoxal phosphate-dependent enzyme [Haloarculaceae archaeon H-GB11]MEA5409410.1 aminotransferase class I/II-fold pyridoxal phosphate-dependent enzyme [Haloarculaceae archaeon H-GB2-1]
MARQHKPSGRDLHPDTLSIKHGEEATPGAPEAGDVVSPIHLATTFGVGEVIDDRDWTEYEPEHNEFFYSRVANPTRHALEKRLAALHDAEFGFAFAAGLSAISAAVMSSVQPGDHVVAFEQVYSGTDMMLRRLFDERLDVDVTFVDATETETVADAMRPETTLVWMETPTNPRIKLCDIEAIADVAHEHGATLGVDNTFMSPYFQRPLELGADVVVDSTTKFINGHTDSTGGAVVTNDEAIADDLWLFQVVNYGCGLPPFDCYLVLRGLKTFPLRMRQHEANATAVAEFLDDHEQVRRVFYPGLESHPQHDLAERQTSGHGGLLSVELDATYDETIRFMEELDVVELAVSLGGVETLVEHPASMTHNTIAPEDRRAIGITDSLLRFSVGVEHIDDIVADLDAALASIE